ncbi:uncharacterized protein LOC122001931 [Zingiber officinale]|uniref:uncharacterized protein LOC122001931 n=1 Tax=Zingiber officinale TaxID=94328 RepID=UPI001C4D450B|nr:uncharacterized protein LOC122001931 [Zingiber officinale]
MNRAQMLLEQDPNYSKGFKFGHVWSILQGIEKFNSDNIKAASTRVQRQIAQADYSQSYNLEKDVYSPSSPHVSSFNLNITDSDSGGTSTKRPIGVKKRVLTTEAELDVMARYETEVWNRLRPRHRGILAIEAKTGKELGSGAETKVIISVTETGKESVIETGRVSEFEAETEKVSRSRAKTKAICEVETKAILATEMETETEKVSGSGVMTETMSATKTNIEMELVFETNPLFGSK